MRGPRQVRELAAGSDGIGRRVNQCKQCLRVPHLAYFIVNQLPLCIRHAADAVLPEDDMGAHHMAHAAYLRLQVDGVRGTY